MGSKNIQTLKQKLSEIKKKEEEQRTKQLAEKLNLPYLNLATAPIDLESLKIIPQEEAQLGRILAIKKNKSDLYLAVQDPSFPKTKEIIKKLQEKGFTCHLFLVSQNSIQYGLKKYPPSFSETRSSLRGIFIIPQSKLDEFEKSLKTVTELKETIKSIPTTELLTIILAGAIKMKASDIHLEPAQETVQLRYRIDGLLHNIVHFPKKHYPFLVSRIKTLSSLLLNVHDRSQDGRFTIHLKNSDSEQSIDIRVSVLPSSYGESITMRLLGIAVAKLHLEELGIRPAMLEIVKKQIHQPFGMILNTGPTGSGKTTTLYACLNYINKPELKIITIENPIEYRLNGITQTQINPQKGYSFAEALKVIVRQDPDILMVGEIRDKESARIATDFALTGHLVFSTLHTNQAAGAIPRLLAMKIKPTSLSSSLNLVIAQRLVRRLCPKCKEKYQLPAEKIKLIKKNLAPLNKKSGFEIPSFTNLYRAVGCSTCHGLGYQGRIGVFEFLLVDETIKELIIKQAPAFEIQKAAQTEQGMITFAQDALLKTIEGITSLEEIKRVIGSLDIPSID